MCNLTKNLFPYDMGFCIPDFQVSKAPVAPIALQIATKATVNNVAKKAINIRDFAVELRRRLESTMGFGWHIVVGSGDFAVDVRYRKGASILLVSKSSKIKVLLYRTTPARAPFPSREHETLAETCKDSATFKRKVVIYESDMPDKMKDAIVEKAKRLYNAYEDEKDTETKMAQSLKVNHSLTFAYGPTWQVIVSCSRAFCCLPIADEGFHADFTLSKLRIVVYRHAGTSSDRFLDSAQFGKRVAFVLALICLLLYVFLALNSSEELQTCKQRSETIPRDDGGLPKGCSWQDMKRANDHAWWKMAAILGMSAFTMIASLIRMYTKSLSAKIKRT